MVRKKIDYQVKNMVNVKKHKNTKRENLYLKTRKQFEGKVKIQSLEENSKKEIIN